MSLQDTLNYVLFTNPLSSTAINLTKKTLSTVLPPKHIEAPIVQVIHDKVPLWKLAREGGPYIRLAGFLGACAVGLGAYGAHKTYPKDKTEHLQRIFETGNRYHFYNTLALLATPLCRYPALSSFFLITGIICFSGSCYYHAITGENKLQKVAPFGGICLILGWAAMIL